METRKPNPQNVLGEMEKKKKQERQKKSDVCSITILFLPK